MRPERSGPGALAGATEAGIENAGQHPDTVPHHPALVGHEDALRHLQRQWQIEALHRLGPRVVAELLDEIARHYCIADDIDRRLARYSALDPATLAAVGGDQFPATPLHLVAGEGDGG